MCVLVEDRALSRRCGCRAGPLWLSENVTRDSDETHSRPAPSIPDERMSGLSEHAVPSAEMPIRKWTKTTPPSGAEEHRPHAARQGPSEVSGICTPRSLHGLPAPEDGLQPSHCIELRFQHD